MLWAVRGGKRPAPTIYLTVVPVAFMLTGSTLIEIGIALPVGAFAWLAVPAAVVMLAGLVMMVVAGRRYRDSTTKQG